MTAGGGCHLLCCVVDCGQHRVQLRPRLTVQTRIEVDVEVHSDPLGAVSAEPAELLQRCSVRIELAQTVLSVATDTNLDAGKLKDAALQEFAMTYRSRLGQADPTSNWDATSTPGGV